MHRSRAVLRPLAVTAVLFAVAAARPPVAEARLAHSSFAKLLRESELICRARVVEVAVAEERSGHVVVECIAVLKGERPPGPIRIDYTGEVHDMVIDKKGEERLLFLKKVDGRWTGTHYGRSYWPLVAAADPALGPVTAFKYPVTMLQFTGRYARLLRPARLGPGVEDTMVASNGTVKIEKMIPLAAVEKAVADLAKQKPTSR
jgi:hypothetical protein